MLVNQAIINFQADLEDQNYSGQTIKGYRSSLNIFLDFVESKYNTQLYIDDISREDIKEFLSHKSEEGCSPSTRNRYLFIFKSFYNYLVRENIVEINLADDLIPVKTRKKERSYLTKSEVKQLAEAVDHPIIKTAIYFAFYTGLRGGELLNLKIGDVDLNERLVYVNQGKGNKDRKVPINSELKDIINNYLNNIRPDVNNDNFFATKISGSLSHQYFNKKLKQAASDLGWNKRTSVHEFRRAFASRLVKQGVNIYKIKELLGHSSIKVTEIYTHVDTNDLEEAVGKL